MEVMSSVTEILFWMDNRVFIRGDHTAFRKRQRRRRCTLGVTFELLLVA